MKNHKPNSQRNPYHSLRGLYLDVPIPFGLKRSLKDACFTAISTFWGEAAFLREWQAQRKFDQRAKSLSLDGKLVYGGDDEFFLHSMVAEWDGFLDLSPEKIGNWLLPCMQKLVRASHLSKAMVNSPKVSVIIPAHGNPLYTLSCIFSLIKQETTVSFDLHIADDNPDDPLLSGYMARIDSPHIHYHMNSRNIGFTLNANQAAERTNSELIVFLNNDTYCHPLWLDQLVTTYEYLTNKSPVGVIGSKVLHTNLSIQESGCLLLQGGISHPLGRGKHAFDPEFSYLREVDFVSACSMLVQKDLFLSLGGFDKRFSPGYYEDPEFCERLKDRGYTSYVQPSSILVHVEGASFGKDGFSSVKTEKMNLFNALHPGVQSIAAQFQAKPRLLYIDAYLPMPDKGSGSVDAMAFIHYFLEQGYRITFYAHHHNNYFEKYTRALESVGVEVLQDNFKPLSQFLAEQSGNVDIVFISRYYQFEHFLPQIKSKLPDSTLIYNTVDLHFLREEREATVEQQLNTYSAHLTKLKKRELEFLLAADASIVISSYELELLRKTLPEATSIYHVPQCRTFIGTNQPFEARNGFVFIGSAHQPNIDAIRYFQSEIHPLLVKQLPDYRFNIIGLELLESLSVETDGELLTNPNISFLGYIENVTPIFDRSIAMVVPLRFGSGIKGKVIQAIQHSLPCITTDIGIEGLDLPSQSCVCIANKPEEFVRQIVALSTDQQFWSKTSDLAASTFISRFSEGIFKQKMDKVMSSVRKMTPEFKQ